MRVVAADGIIIKNGKILLIKRKHWPFSGMWAIPGGKVKTNEPVKIAVIREVKEETNLKVRPVKLLGIYDEPKRDPRGIVISLAFICKIISGNPKAGSDAKDAKWFTKSQVKNMKLAFDHKKMLHDAGFLK